MSAPTRTSPASFVKHAADVAAYYGFRHAKEIERSVPNLERLRTHTFVSVSAVCAASFAARPEPALAYWASPSPSHLPAGLSPREVGEFGLHIAGTQGSVGEAMLIKTLATIATEWGAAVGRVRLNALGDRDSKARYARELSFYFRKHHDALCELCRARVARDPFAPFSCQTSPPAGGCRAIAESAPRAMNFLSEKSRAHFKDVLEHVESLGLPYELDDLLVGDEREPQVLFEFDFAEPDATIETALGGRFEAARRSAARPENSGVSASVFFRKKGLSAGSFAPAASRKTPRVFFVQLGLRAKMQGLSVLDDLRRARVPVLSTFDSARLAPQLDAARAAKVTHLIIMGAREAMDGTVIIRSMDNSAQTTIELRTLPRFLKTLR